jgi:galactose mutarotase-like enzyme
MRRTLVDPWPFGGLVRGEIRVTPDALDLVVEVPAGEAAMPSAVGWHSWFMLPADGKYTRG